jgi:hypothetical protein
MTAIDYVREEDRQEYRKFCMHHLPTLARTEVNEVWHYTNADGLIGILTSGRIWSTQIACLNDSLEHRYFAGLVHAAVKVQRKRNTDPNIDVLLRVADDALSNADTSKEGRFAACFSEVKDDLAQWRGYGGGECGYSIGFRYAGILEAIKCRPSALFIPMHYEDHTHKFIVDDVVRIAQVYFLDGLKRGFTDIEKWAVEFLWAFSVELEIFSSLIKHPKFSGELERRVTTLLQPGEHAVLEFRQKRTLLARHLPIDLTIPMYGVKRPHITRIYIGPGPSQQVSRISVGDLLLKLGYENVPVLLSEVPYRVP